MMERKNFNNQRGLKTPGEHGPPNSKQDSHGLKESEAASMWPAWVYTRSTKYRLWLLAWCFVGILTVGACVALILLSAPETLLPICLPSPASKWGLLLCLIVSCFVVFAWCFLAYLMRNRWGGGMNLGNRVWRDLRGVGKGEAVFRIFCMREAPIYNKTHTWRK